jgi:hypothetical protein
MGIWLTGRALRMANRRVSPPVITAVLTDSPHDSRGVVYILAPTEKQPFESGDLAIAFLVAVTFLRVNGRVFSGREIESSDDTANLAMGKCPRAMTRVGSTPTRASK